LTYINGRRRRGAHDAMRIDLAGAAADAMDADKKIFRRALRGALIM
jgi:hypothetical protein